MHINSGKWKCVMAVLLLVAITTPAIGADRERFSIYGWRDDAGIQHYTNELADVPDADRNRVTTLIKDWVPPEPPAQAAVGSIPDDTAQTAQTSAAPMAATTDVPQSNVTYDVDASQSSSVVQEYPLAAEQPVPFDDFIPAGGRASFGSGARPSPDSFRAAGPSPRNAAGPPPMGAAGPPPFGSAGHSPVAFATGRR